MRYRLLGHSGLRVSELCLGTLNFGETKRWGAVPDEARQLLRMFADAGGSFIDTAPNYAAGVAEEIVGQFVQGVRHDYVIATKFTASQQAHPLAGGNSRKAMLRSVEGSLQRLRTDHIDMLWLHYWDGTTALDEILRGVDDLVTAGKVLYFGISNTPAWLVSRATTLAEALGRSKPVAVQVEYNLAARTAERELLPMARALDLGMVCWGPLAAGALAGGQRCRLTDIPPRLAHAADELANIAEETGQSSVALAHSWLTAQGCIPVVGARTPAQLQATLAREEIDGEWLQRLNAVAPPELGYPHDLIGSPYLRRLALGAPENMMIAERSRS